VRRDRGGDELLAALALLGRRRGRARRLDLVLEPERVHAPELGERSLHPRERAGEEQRDVLGLERRRRSRTDQVG